ncbi:unnamed protein product [Aureobasidium mustum]|uniref:Carboxylesterase type B domain-containing protein n=1 Tax=Aureobasidium mustum TaxID=2773714 RepID=A0A9N8K875_9PEZI|nr:unnamed protein product [Aureobasidium mustum]
MTGIPFAFPPCGPVQGFRTSSVVRYTGIPYATAARFEVPQPTADWTSVFQADSPCPACPQPTGKGSALVASVPLLQGTGISEVCQFLSVTVPPTATLTDKLPVMVWVYGGSFESGAGDSPIYDPSRLVAEHQVIVVNINYRLNIFGFLGDGEKRPANLGLLDQLEALRWVRRYIPAFGGTDDPKSITFFGQSAGGSSVADLMAVPGAPALFGRAIIQSAPFGLTRGRDELNSHLLKKAKSASRDMTVAEMIELCEKIDKAGSKKAPKGEMPFAPQYGYAPLPAEADLNAALNTNAPLIDMLVGSTDSEASLFLPFFSVVGVAIDAPIVGKSIHNHSVSKLNNTIYHPYDRTFAERHVLAGGKASLYRIKFSNKTNRLGACHTIDLPLLFGNKEVYDGAKILEGFSPEQIDLAGEQMRAIWADFAKGKQVHLTDSVLGLIEIAEIVDLSKRSI